MKTRLFVFFFVLFAGSLAAQTETLFGRARVVGGFGSLIYEVGINNNLHPTFGAGGGIVINSFFLGVYGSGSADFTTWDGQFNRNERLDLGQSGLWLGFAIPSRRLVHLFTSARLGWGVVNVDLNNDNQRFEDLDQVLVATPEIGLELNITRWLRLAGTVGYRFVNGTETNPNYNNDTFSGALGAVTLRIGGFGRNR